MAMGQLPRWSDQELVEIQVRVPVCLTLRFTRVDAESMRKDELCDVVDCVLEDATETLEEVDNDYAAGGVFRLCAQTEASRPIDIEWQLAPKSDNLLDDECELIWTEEGLFPGRADR